MKSKKSTSELTETVGYLFGLAMILITGCILMHLFWSSGLKRDFDSEFKAKCIKFQGTPYIEFNGNLVCVDPKPKEMK